MEYVQHLLEKVEDKRELQKRLEDLGAFGEAVKVKEEINGILEKIKVICLPS